MTILPLLPPVVDSSRPAHHRYPVLAIRLCLTLVVDLHISCRAAACVLALFAACLSAAAPCFATVRLWLCRLGLFLLRRAVAAVAGGWVLVIDHTVQMGQHKCFVALGLHAARLSQIGYTPDCSDVTVLAVEVMDNPTGEKVHSVLQRVQKRIGSVAQVVSDNGAELTNGIKRLQEQDPNIVSSYDVRHMLACLLKAQLAECPRWKGFLEGCARTLPKLRQTSGNFLAPPTLRVKARYMNLETHVGWADRLLAWRQKEDWQALSEALGKANAAEAQSWFDEKLGWLTQYGQDVARWRGMLEVADLALSEVQSNGLSRQTAKRFWCRWIAGKEKVSWQEAEFANEVRQGLSRESEKIPQGKTLLGSSDVIESLLGKYKVLVEKSPQGELGPSVLLLPLLGGGTMSREDIKEGLETVSVEETRQWIKETLGESPRSKKRRLLGTPNPSAPFDGPKAA